MTVSANQSNGETVESQLGRISGVPTWARRRCKKLTESGGWMAVSVKTTRGGPGGTLTIDVPNGTYRAVVRPAIRYRGELEPVGRAGEIGATRPSVAGVEAGELYRASRCSLGPSLGGVFPESLACGKQAETTA